MDFNPQTPDQFNHFRQELRCKQGSNPHILDHSLVNHKTLSDSGYFYQFDYLGLPVLQTPADLLQLHDVIYTTRPNVIIETGIARGGSLLYYASQLLLLKELDLIKGTPKVIGVDVLIHDYNRRAIKNSPLSDIIILVEGSSIDTATVESVRSHLVISDNVMVSLDSYHTHCHVSEELRIYSELVSSGRYLVVFGTVIEQIDKRLPGSYENRSWGIGNNPFTAVTDFLTNNDNFELRRDIDEKLLISGAFSGWLQRISPKPI